MLEIKDLSKSYGKNKVLGNIDLEIEENKIYGLLGRNGVGKTTLLKLITGQLMRDSGQIVLDGEEVLENPRAMEDFCLVREFSSSIKEKKVKDILNLARIMYKDWDEEYEKFLIQEFGLDTKKKLIKLSTGNQTIVGLIIGLASRTRFTIFDEPTLGLDAAIRYKFYKLMLTDYEEHPRTIIISTHLIDEVSNLFEEIIILKDKELALKEDVDSLKKKAYFLSGREDNINKVTNGKKIIHREDFGSTKIVGIFGDLTKDEIANIKKHNIEISSIPLQKLFIYLTDNMIKEVE